MTTNTTKVFEVIFVQGNGSATKFFDSIEECVQAAATVRAKFGQVSVTIVEHFTSGTELLVEVVDGKVPFQKNVSGWRFSVND